MITSEFARVFTSYKAKLEKLNTNFSPHFQALSSYIFCAPH